MDTENDSTDENALPPAAGDPPVWKLAVLAGLTMVGVAGLAVGGWFVFREQAAKPPERSADGGAAAPEAQGETPAVPIALDGAVPVAAAPRQDAKPLGAGPDAGTTTAAAADTTTAAATERGPASPTGGWQPDADERALNDALNAKLGGGLRSLRFNRIPAGLQAPPDRADQALGTVEGPRGRAVPVVQGTADAVKAIQEQAQKELNVGFTVAIGWMSHARRHRLRFATPGVDALPGMARHLVDGVDLHPRETGGRQPLTLDLAGKPILLEDLRTPAGKERFRQVVMKIEEDALRRAKPRAARKLVEGWVRTAPADLRAGVWGVADVTMELWAAQGFKVGHCGAVVGEPWHAEPAADAAACTRFSTPYKARLRAFRRRPPARWDDVTAALDKAEAAPWPAADAAPPEPEPPTKGKKKKKR